MSLTTNQSRDRLIESFPMMVNDLRILALDCESDRKKDLETYSKCPRCYGHHSVRGNFDNLCDGCVKTILEHFPEHESVAGIKKCLSRLAGKSCGKDLLTQEASRFVKEHYLPKSD